VNALHDPDEGVPAGSSMATESAVRGGAGSTESTWGQPARGRKVSVSMRSYPMSIDSTGAPLMKAFVAALIAAGILFAVDKDYNDGRYTEVIQRAITSVF
jgi:hypothetical protein